MSQDVLVIGKKDTILGFKSIGFETLFWDIIENPETVLHSFIEDGAKIIFVTEDILQVIQPIITQYSGKLYPMFVSIPSLQTNTGIGYRNVEKLMVQALGTGTVEE